MAEETKKFIVNVPEGSIVEFKEYCNKKGITLQRISQSQGTQRRKLKPLCWVEVPGGGRLCARWCPKKQEAAEWKKGGATAVVTLLHYGERQWKEIGQECRDSGIIWLHLPLSGKSALYSAIREKTDIESFARISEVARMLADGESVVIHCSAGMHRTGIVCYLTLRERGFQSTEALNLIKSIREITHEELVKTTRKIKVSLLELAEKEFTNSH